MNGYETYGDMPLFDISKNGSAFERPMKNKEVASEKRLAILKALREGPLTTFEVEHKWHRGQATIGELRSSGFDIEQIGGVYTLISEPNTQLRCVTKTIQSAYYTTNHWVQCRKARRSIDADTCQQCKSTDALEVHHWVYHLFNECIATELITFCATCHKRVHECATGSTHIHFPRRLDEQIIQRILNESQSSGTDN